MEQHDRGLSASGGVDAGFLRALRRLVPSDALIEPEDLRRVYESDALTAKREIPWRVVIPRTVEEVQAVVRLCARFQVPVVARGAGTGLSGGAMPCASGILLSLARFTSILSIDAENCTAVVQPGVTNLAISRAVSHLGLYYAPDPSSQLACTIGGNVAENAGGVHCLKYGLTVHNVQRLKVVLPDGELVTLGSHGLDAPGYDLLALLCGSEGMLGIVVEATVRLLPSPPRAGLILAAFASVREAGDAVGRVIAGGIIPAGLEMMDRLAVQAVEAYAHIGYPQSAEAVLLCEVDGTDEEVVDHLAAAERILRESGAREIRVARDEAERQLWWRGRKSAFAAAGRLAPDYYCMDGTIPRREIGSVLEEIARLAEEHGLPVANVFHAGDGNLHPLILYHANAPGERDRAEALGARILETCVERGGTITGEHGVGVEKIRQMCVQFSEAEIAQFHRLKEALDPAGLLNPGKAIPTLNQCREYTILRRTEPEA